MYTQRLKSPFDRKKERKEFRFDLLILTQHDYCVSGLHFENLSYCAETAGPSSAAYREIKGSEKIGEESCGTGISRFRNVR